MKYIDGHDYTNPCWEEHGFSVYVNDVGELEAAIMGRSVGSCKRRLVTCLNKAGFPRRELEFARQGKSVICERFVQCCIFSMITEEPLPVPTRFESCLSSHER